MPYHKVTYKVDRRTGEWSRTVNEVVLDTDPDAGRIRPEPPPDPPEYDLVQDPQSGTFECVAVDAVTAERVLRKVIDRYYPGRRR